MSDKPRETLGSRLGFIFLSAGCAIGLGNVWRFPFITGQYGGAVFVLIYMFFLLFLALPILVMEFAVGRASQQSVSKSFSVLYPKGGLHDVLYCRSRMDACVHVLFIRRNS